MGARRHPVHDVLAGDDPRQRQSGRDALGHDQDVRLHVPVADREDLAGAGEARLDLVGDQQDPVLPGDLPEPRQEPGRRDEVAALADDRLHDDRGHLVREDELVEQQVQLRLPVAGAVRRVVRPAGRPVAVRVGGVVDGSRQRLEGAPVHVLRRRQRHRLGGAAVERVAERDDRRPPRRHARQLDGGLDGLGAGVRQEGAPWSARQEVRQAIVEAQPGLVVDDVLLAVEQLRGLGLHGGHDSRMGVARVRDADPRRVVEVPVALGRDQPAALAVVHDQVRDPAPDRGHHRAVGEGSAVALARRDRDHGDLLGGRRTADAQRRAIADRTDDRVGELQCQPDEVGRTRCPSVRISHGRSVLRDPHRTADGR